MVKPAMARDLPMKLAVYQALVTDGDIAGALARLRGALVASAAAGARMLVAPELLLPGYNRPDLHATTAQGRDGPWMSALRDMAREAGCGLTLGWAERAGGQIYNAATAIGADGAILAHYRKIQLFGPMERESFTAGDAAPLVFDLEGRRAGLLICYDIEFPGHAAGLAGAGADLVLVPTANPAGYEHVQELLVPTRAYENRLCVAYANYCGQEAGLGFGGRSLIAGPDGRPLAAAGTTETLLIAKLPAADTFPPDRLSTQDRDYRRPDGK